MTNDRSGPPHYENTYNPQPPVEPGNVPYADYFRSICPGAQRPRNQWAHYKYQTTYMNIASAYWDARERARIDWEASADELSRIGDPSARCPLAALRCPRCLSQVHMDRPGNCLDRRRSVFRQSTQHWARSRSSSSGRSPSSDFRT